MADSKTTKSKCDTRLLEEAAEFEEFPAENWTEKDEDDKDVDVWEQNWDDDNVDDDFNVKLRAELEKQDTKAGK